MTKECSTFAFSVVTNKGIVVKNDELAPSKYIATPKLDYELATFIKLAEPSFVYEK